MSKEDEHTENPEGRVSEPLKQHTSLLDIYGRDLTAQAARGKIGPAIAREHELDMLVQTLVRSPKLNPLLLGDAGVGKTALVEGLAYAINQKSAPKPLLEQRIVQLDFFTWIGTPTRDQVIERMTTFMAEIKNSRNIILFMDEIHTIVGSETGNIVIPVLVRGELKCIGATTHEEYRRTIAQEKTLDQCFRIIDIKEPSQEDTLLILEGQRTKLETHHGVLITPEAIKAAVELSVRYLPDRRLPDKALDLLDEACPRVILPSHSPDADTNPGMEVRVETIAQVLSDWTGVPVSELLNK